VEKLKIHFVDFWPGFSSANNYFFHLLSEEFEVVLDEEDPDLLFFSVDYGRENKREKYKEHRCKKIFYTGEGVSPNFENEESVEVSNHEAHYCIGKCDFAFTFDFSKDVRNYRLPLWAMHIDWFNKKGYTNPKYLIPLNEIDDNSFIRNPRTKFCVSIFSNPVANRVEAFNKLSEYSSVDGFGKPFGNWTDGEDIKYNILKDYKFSLCFESLLRHGYYTEKLFHAKTAGTVPVYSSDALVAHDFNPASFINLNSFNNIDELVDHVIKVDQDDDLYYSYKQEPLFSNKELGASIFPGAVLNYFKETILS